jgi:hypothetical protein
MLVDFYGSEGTEFFPLVRISELCVCIRALSCVRVFPCPTTDISID